MYSSIGYRQVEGISRRRRFISATMFKQPWPSTLWLIRHGQSAGNVARYAAEAAGELRIDIADRDIDVPLSPLGQRQSEALGRWFSRLPPAEQPQVVVCSPYSRALGTARHVITQAGLRAEQLRQDERLREKEFGIVDRYTPRGIADKYPELSEQRRHVGKFYFRPPGGESWCDVILRLRSLMEMVTREYEGKRVLIVAHQVIVNCMRYLMEHLDESAILEIDRQGDVPNCAITSYQLQPGTGEVDDMMKLDLLNFIAPMEDSGVPVTVEADASAAPKP